MGRIIGRIKNGLKYRMILKHEYIRFKYWEYYAENPDMDMASKLRRLKKTISLNLEYKSRGGQNQKKVMPTTAELVARMEDYDIISFDIFDTLLLRPVEYPSAVFSHIEAKYDFPHFHDWRLDAERKARVKSETGEVNIHEIYDVLSEWSDMDIDLWMKREMDAELLMCMPNPYFREVCKNLKEKNIRMIAVSDMYLPQEHIEKMLEKCGYSEYFEKVFISNVFRESKGSGELFDIVKEQYPGKRLMHVGDNLHSDYVNARKHGVEAWNYPNVNETFGIRSLLYHMSRLTGAVTKGVINSYLNCGIEEYNDYFKFGMINGGLLSCGYCEYLNEVVKEKKIDKILFLARDGYIIKEVYDRHYHECDTEYILFSRFCSEQILFDKYTEDYIKHNIKYRLSLERKVSFGQILKEVDLEFLLPELKTCGLKSEDILTNQNSDKLIDFIYRQKTVISEYFNATQENVYEYLKPLLEGCANILTVDLGWFGTGGLALKYLLEEKYDTGINVFSALVGTNEDTSLEGRIATKTLFPYAYSPVHNLYVLHWHTRHQYNIHNLLIELMFSAPQPSFLKFERNGQGELTPFFSYDEKENYDIINNIHAGILKFAELFNDLDPEIKDLLEINGGDAYAGFMSTADNHQLCYDLFKDYKISQLSGIFGEKTITTMGEIMKEDHYI